VLLTEFHEWYCHVQLENFELKSLDSQGWHQYSEVRVSFNVLWREIWLSKKSFRNYININIHGCLDILLFSTRQIYSYKREQILLNFSSKKLIKEFNSSRPYRSNIKVFEPEKLREQEINWCTRINDKKKKKKKRKKGDP